MLLTTAANANPRPLSQPRTDDDNEEEQNEEEQTEEVLEPKDEVLELLEVPARIRSLKLQLLTLLRETSSELELQEYLWHSLQ